MKVCTRCHGWPCVCDYIRKLGSGAYSAQMTQRALEAARMDHPADLSCPCPFCLRDRRTSWGLHLESET